MAESSWVYFVLSINLVIPPSPPHMICYDLFGLYFESTIIAFGKKNCFDPSSEKQEKHLESIS